MFVTSNSPPKTITVPEPQTTPKQIFHYCPPEAAISILKSKTLWLSNGYMTNDRTEANHVIEYLFNIANKHIKDILFGDYFESIRYNSCDPYIASFSEDGDSLSQWVHYGNDGTGVAIGFDPLKLDVGTDLPYPSREESSMALRSVSYVDLDRDRKFKRMFQGVLSNYKENAGGLEMSNLSLLIKFLSFAAKHHKYRHEREWRLIYIPWVLMGKDSSPDVVGKFNIMEFRYGGGQLIPYFEFPIPASNEPIKTIVLGPRNEFNTNLFQLMLLSLGYKDIDIIKSRTPYRGNQR